MDSLPHADSPTGRAAASVVTELPTPPSLSGQTTAQLGGRRSVLARQRRDHTRLEELLQQLTATTGERQDAVLRDLARLVFPHAFAEESVLWPVVRRSLPDGEALTLQVEQEHQEVNALWTQLERTPHGDPTRAELIARLAEVLREDARDEEDVMLPRLQAVLDDATLRRLGAAWAAVDAIAPTRPHPTVARRPPGNVVAALPLTVLDRSRDRLDAAAGRGPDRWRAGATAVSRRLADVAGKLEQLPPLRAGEDPSTAVGRGAPT